MLLQYLAWGVVTGSLYALMALGLALVYGILRILDIANAGAYTLGAYVGLLAYRGTHTWWLALLAAMAVSAVLGYLMQRWLYRPILSSEPIIPLIAGIGVFIVLEEVYRLVFGPYILAFRAHLPVHPIHPFGVFVTGIQVVILIVAVLALTAVWLLLNRTRVGLAWKACSQDREMATAFGINVGRVTAWNFMLGYALAATAGVLVGINYEAVSPTMGEMPAYKMLAIIVLGGLGNPIGTIVAALFIGIVETLTAGYLGFLLPRDAIAFIALIIVLLVRPQGLFGRSVVGA